MNTHHEIDYIGMFVSYELGLTTDEENQELFSLGELYYVCSCCGLSKPISEFYFRHNAVHKTTSRCKYCNKKYYDNPNSRMYMRLNQAKHRARKEQLAHSLTAYEWKAILEHYEYRCAYCGKTESEAGTLAQDHVYPFSRGGGYTIHNIVPACKSCNSRKHAKTPEEAGMKLKRLPLKQISMFE